MPTKRPGAPHFGQSLTGSLNAERTIIVNPLGNEKFPRINSVTSGPGREIFVNAIGLVFGLVLYRVAPFDQLFLLLSNFREAGGSLQDKQSNLKPRECCAAVCALR
jgi:hypothetical protein